MLAAHATNVTYWQGLTSCVSENMSGSLSVRFRVSATEMPTAAPAAQPKLEIGETLQGWLLSVRFCR